MDKLKQFSILEGNLFHLSGDDATEDKIKVRRTISW